jgi:secondary thiamine-phosphate synthase enzyme
MVKFSVKTSARTDFINITREVANAVKDSGIADGVVTVFVPHTTAGVQINENADPDVMRDIKVVMDEVVPWSNNYWHAEGNTAAHVKAAMMGTTTQIIVEDGRLQLGTWQGIYFCEFDGPRQRSVWVKI